MNRNRHGAALALTVLLLAMMMTMVGALLFPAVMDRRLSRNAVRIHQALAAAESGTEVVVAGWGRTDAQLAAGTGAGARATWSFDGTLATGWYRGQVRRLNDRLFLIVAEGFSSDSVARQRVGLLVLADTASVVSRAGWVRLP